ncbi:MAG TPA: periplasmic heavy metal sensor [Pyrinomonadaceae bacterium]|nr:periplasmic heavy metal sensor [Pyrinomonadaceae bacterium]
MREFIKKLRARESRFVGLLLLILFFSAGIAGARAQDVEAPVAQPGARRESGARRPGAGGLLRALNLTPEQRAQINAIRRETEPQGRAFGARLRQARRALDEAIYSANPEEAVVENLVRELSAAQAAVVRLRSLTELRIRRVLSPAQLDAFRRLRLQSRTRARRMNQPPRQRDDSPGDAPARFGNRTRRRAHEQQQRQRSMDERNAPPATRAPVAAPSRDGKP